MSSAARSCGNAHAKSDGPSRRARSLGKRLFAVLALGTGLALAAPGSPPPGVTDPYQLAEIAGQRHGLPPMLMSALVYHESRGNAQAVSRAGAIGLAQLMPGTAASLGVNPRDPWQNVWGGAKYLAAQLRTFGRLDLALAAYNAGPGAVQRHGGIPPFNETQNYVRLVSSTYTAWSGTGGTTVHTASLRSGAPQPGAAPLAARTGANPGLTPMLVPVTPTLAPDWYFRAPGTP